MRPSGTSLGKLQFQGRRGDKKMEIEVREDQTQSRCKKQSRSEEQKVWISFSASLSAQNDIVSSLPGMTLAELQGSGLPEGASNFTQDVLKHTVAPKKQPAKIILYKGLVMAEFNSNWHHAAECGRIAWMGGCKNRVFDNLRKRWAEKNFQACGKVVFDVFLLLHLTTFLHVCDKLEEEDLGAVCMGWWWREISAKWM
jgi:hypothetical protein